MVDRELGTGLAPRYEEWTVDDHYIRAECLGVDPFGGDVPIDYDWADFAYAHEYGFVWPCCPRYFSEFASDHAMAEARRIMSMVRASEDAILSAQWQVDLTSREVWLYRLVKSFEVRQHMEANKSPSKGVGDADRK